ncbi:helix-hairpin-helix domain-containing protein [Paenibacillus sp. M1]|uniref:Helix-hairpin-helix domain-containing protein n=1 Tax=Paenibacillus haidiansis TaxID=1574488 RepID=A0ABU7VLX8_9BACL
MKKEYVITSVVSAAIGAGLMLLAVGSGKPAGIEGWIPLNESVAAAMAEQGQPQPQTAAQAGGTGSDAKTSPQADAGGQGQVSAGINPPANGNTAGTGEAVTASGPGTTAAGTAGNAGEASAAGADAAAKPQQTDQSGLISINTAGISELQEIPGIGEKKAQAIIDYRNQHGLFRSVNDLTKVKGIGDKMLEKMKPYIGL